MRKRHVCALQQQAWWRDCDLIAEKKRQHGCPGQALPVCVCVWRIRRRRHLSHRQAVEGRKKTDLRLAAAAAAEKKKAAVRPGCICPGEGRAGPPLCVQGAHMGGKGGNDGGGRRRRPPPSCLSLGFPEEERLGRRKNMVAGEEDMAPCPPM